MFHDQDDQCLKIPENTFCHVFGIGLKDLDSIFYYFYFFYAECLFSEYQRIFIKNNLQEVLKNYQECQNGSC